MLGNFSIVTQKRDKRDQGQGSQSHALTSEEVKRTISEQEEPGHLADTIAGFLNLTATERQKRH